MDTTKWPLGPVLEAARLDRELATKEAARRAGVSDTLWRNLERGYELRKGVRFDVSPRPETVIKVARVVGVDTTRALELAGLPNVDPADWDEPDLTGVSDEHLLGEVRRRMQVRKRDITAAEVDADPNMVPSAPRGDDEGGSRRGAR